MWKAVLALALCAASVQAQERAGRVIFALGDAQRIALEGGAAPLSRGDAVLEGELIRTGAGSHLQLLMSDGARIALRPESELRVKSYRDELALVELMRGAFRSITGVIGRRDKERYRVESSRVVLGIRGTDHEMLLRTAGEDAGTYNRVSAGGTYLQTPEGRVDLDPGEAGFAPLAPGKAPVRLANTPAFMLAKLPPAGEASGPALRDAAAFDEHRLERAADRGVRALGAPAHGAGRALGRSTGDPHGRSSAKKARR
jgi:ferric-dicitrate binding protein FerR (iron transport regulator)